MGGKTETHTDLSCSRMFDDDDNLFIGEVMRIVSEIETQNPRDVMNRMVTDQNMFFNEAVFERAGALSNVDFKTEEITKSSVNSYIIQSIDSSAEYVQEYFVQDANGRRVDSTILKTLEALQDLYTPGTCSQTMYQKLTSGNSVNEYEVLYTSFYIDSKEYRVKTISDSNGIRPVLATDASNFLYVTMEEIDSLCVLLGSEEILVKIPTDDREVFAVDYHTTNDLDKHIFIFTDYVMKVGETTKCFTLGLMKDFEWMGTGGDDPVGEDKYRKFLFARFGIGAEDEDGNSMEKSMEEAEYLEMSFMTYATDRYDDKFGYLVDTVYGFEEAPKTITITGGDFNITYSGGSNRYGISLDQGGFSADARKCMPGECGEDEPGASGPWQPRYIIPTSILRKLPMKDKFDVYNRMFCIWNYTEQTVEIKWYQTEWFRVVMFIISIVLTYLTAGLWAAVFSAVMQIGLYVLAKTNPELALAIGVIVAVMTADVSSLSGILTIANQVITVASYISAMGFRNDLEEIKNDIEKYTKEEREAAEAIEDIQGQAIWLGSGYNDAVIWTGFEMPYLAPELNAMSADPQIAMDRLQSIYPN